LNLNARLYSILISARKSGSWSDHSVLVNEILSAYQQPGRHYHTLRHIEYCLDAVDRYKQSGVSGPIFSQGTVELALWYHDLVYDPRAIDNEERSVAVLREHEALVPLDPVIVGEACSAILATCHRAPPIAPLDKFVVDVDLSILAAPEERFNEYERGVRAEYCFVPDSAWIAGRSQVLQDFVNREWVYSFPYFRMRFEGAARANLKRSIARLARGEILQ
jgi:predicted metal-dependent HD superfamily phosphohydrolase